MNFLKVAYLVFLFGVLANAETTPCTKHPGRPYNNEGTGACTGNNSLEIPLTTLGFSFIYNSQNPDTTYGAGWSISADSVFEKTTASVGKLILGDATPIAFSFNGSKWLPTPKIAYDGEFTAPTASTLKQDNPDGSSLTYTKIGTTSRYGLTSITSRKGTLYTITRNTTGQITQMKNFFLQTMPFTYVSGKLSTVKDFKGSTYTFTYTGTNLTRITYPDGLYVSFVYNGSQLISYTDRKNRTTTFTYTGTGTTSVISSMTNYEGHITTYNYTSSAVTVQGFNIKSVENFASNASSGITITGEKNGLDFTRVYDNQSRLLEHTNHFGNTNRFLYSGTNPNPIEIQKADGTSLLLTYDAKNHITQKRFLGSSNSVTTAYTRNAYEQVTNITTTGPSGSATETIAYDTKGNMTQATNSAGKVIYQATYNTSSLPTSLISIEGYNTTKAYSPYGKATSITYPTGEVVNNTYDLLGLLLTVSKPGANYSGTNTYDLISRQVFSSRSLAGPAGTYQFLNNSTYGQVSTQNVLQNVYNTLILKQSNTTLDIKNRLKLFEVSAPR